MRASSTASARRGRAGAGCLLALCLLAAAATPAAGLYDLSLERLEARGALALEDYRGHVLLLSFFEPGCAWCYRQLRTLERLQARCGQGLRPIAVGINGRNDALRRELRRAQVTFPGTRASAALLALTGEVPATPWTLVMTPDGELAATLRGFVREAPLAAAFPERCPQS